MLEVIKFLEENKEFCSFTLVLTMIFFIGFYLTAKGEASRVKINERDYVE